MNAIPDPERLPKILGADFEVGNFITGLPGGGDSGRAASSALLTEIEGFPRVERRHASSCNCVACVAKWGFAYGGVTTEPVYDPQDRGRRFAGTGHCFYIDLDHLEFCLPEVRSARDFVAAKRAALARVRRALRSANAGLPAGQRLVVLLNNSDGQGHSYGSHYNFLVTRSCWDRIFGRRLQHLLWLAAYQASAAVLFGAGKVGSENGVARARYSLSGRADFLEVLLGTQTTWQRPICNARDEPLCGDRRRRSRSARRPEGARSHVICFDHCLCDGAVFLTAGVGQIVHALLEDGRVSLAPLLDDPLGALSLWSQDPTLTATAALLDGTPVTAVELQRLFFAEATRFAERGGLDGFVPGWAEILDYWDGTLRILEARDFAAAARRLDWALKLRTLEEGMRQRPTLTWDSPESKHLDLAFASLDESEGIFWALEAAGETERLVSDDDVALRAEHAPEDTRAWTRAALLQRGGDAIDDVDWDRVRFKTHDRFGQPQFRVVHLPEPAGSSKSDTAVHFRKARTLEELLTRLGATREEPFAPRTETRGHINGGPSHGTS